MGEIENVNCAQANFPAGPAPVACLKSQERSTFRVLNLTYGNHLIRLALYSLEMERGLSKTQEASGEGHLKRLTKFMLA